MKYLLSVAFLSAFFTFIFWFAGTGIKNEISYISPLSDLSTYGKNKQATFLDLWFPFMQDAYGQESELPELTAKSVLLYDLSSDKVIFEKNAKTRRPMASLTKIMTAIISLENSKNDDLYMVSGENLVGEDSMGLSAGEKLTRKELLYGLMLPSGNDASEVLASNYQDNNRTGFIRAMNDKARVLGLTDTVFSNPSGLQGDGVQHTTAYDMLVITRYALENFPLFAEIVSKPLFEISATSTHKTYSLYNETNLLATYPGVKGVKTGYTPEAGMCLITYLEYGGHKIIGVILNSENRRKEMKELLDYSLKSLGIEPPEFTGG